MAATNDVRIKTTIDLETLRASFQEGIGVFETEGSKAAQAFSQAFGGNFVPAAGFTTQGAEAAMAFTKTFDENLQRWRDQNGKFTTPPITVDAQVNIPPANFQIPSGSLTGGLVQDRAELEQYIARLKQAEADMKAMG